MPRPRFFIVGEPKCGTTALYHALRQHPEVFMPKFKEPHHFATDLWQRRSGQAYARVARRNAYLDLFADARSALAIGEASVHYLESAVAASNIAEFDPESRIIAMFRNPVDFLHSIHAEWVAIGAEPVEDFFEALEATLEDRLRLGIPANNRFNYGWTYSRAIRFAEHLSRYFAVFPREQVKVILFDDLDEDMDAVVREVFEFLGVDPSFRPEPADRNPSRVVSRRWLMRLVWSRNPIRLWAAQLLPMAARRRLLYRLRRLGTEVRPRAPLTPEQRTRLLEVTIPEVEALETLIGRDLSAWKRA